PQNKAFELLYEVVGQGTKLLSQTKVGTELDILGPLGNGFSIDNNKKLHIVVGGGMGVAPLMELTAKLKQPNSKIIVLIGANTKENALLEREFMDIADKVYVTTDDGSYGEKGFVTELLTGIQNNAMPTNLYEKTTIYACGPKPMLKAVAEIAAKKKIDCQVSVEQRMACGFGTCLGCVIETINGYKKVCEDGPVFNSKEIKW
ncbi:MAG: dihydroorotate dehydrogenase electron transfer subunit, partial [bacterium]